ncbi:UNVERIFIED_CONTAM: protein OCTOPUS [Sesamum calycinum]|uniref:Protein OCTOPUS n=1 Tax=Sesamum calycinum TaxID=2727403 RepID=A0AAW2NXT0_9LAMI
MMNKGFLFPQQIVDFARNYLNAFVMQNSVHSPRRPAHHHLLWQAPQEDCIKINFDGALLERRNSLGLSGWWHETPRAQPEHASFSFVFLLDPTAPPPPPPQPPRSSFSCDRHPNEHFTGFCPSCLCERLHTLDSSSNTPSSSRRPSSASAAAAAIKSLFSSTSKSNNFPPPPPLPKPSKPSSFFPEPRVKVVLITINPLLLPLLHLPHQNLQNSKKVESCLPNKPVFEEEENEEDFKDPENIDDVAFVDDDGDEDGDEIRPVHDSHLEGLRNVVEVDVNSGKIVEEEVVLPSNLKPMKDHILDTQKRVQEGDFGAQHLFLARNGITGGGNRRLRSRIMGENLATLPVEKPISRQYRETQSEIADYGFGRRSCDTDPRFSLDAGRISLDDPRYSFDEPRASWDGYLIGRSFPRMAPMVSVLEDAPAAHVSRSDMQIPVEEPTMKSNNEEEGLPGGSAQTREYYLDSSSRRRKSLDRSSSIRKTAAAVVAEIDELKVVSNAKVSPTTTDNFQGAKVLVGERDSRDSNSNSLRDDLSETFELSGGFRDSINSVIGNGERKESKKSRRWSSKIWGFIHRRNGGNKDEDEEEKYSRANGVERSLSESWQDLRREGNGDVKGGFNRNMFRSNSSVSWRNANHIGGSFASMRKSAVEMNGHGKKRNEFVLEKNRSARYSPNHLDNGLLRFYLTPMRSSRRGGLAKVKPNNSHSIARSVLRLY